jgi:hypothetical protein
VAVSERTFSAFKSTPSFVTSHSDLFLNHYQGKNGKEFNASENG